MRGHCSCLTWRSFWGFQSLSKMTMVLAEVRVMPWPPARVDSRNTKESSVSPAQHNSERGG